MDKDLIEHTFDRNNRAERIKIHPGKDAEKTAQLAAIILEYRDKFHLDSRDNTPDMLDAAVDTDCLVLSKDSNSPFQHGTRLFDLACAYAPDTIVAAMMLHPDTPVGKTFGFATDTHSALTFLAKTIAGGRSDPAKYPGHDRVTHNRKMAFKLLIEDPRTPVDYRVPTYEGGRSDDVLDVLKKHETVEGVAYYSLVSHLLWQRQAAIATHWDFRKTIFKAFAAANKELIAHASFRRLVGGPRRTFAIDVQSDLKNQFSRTWLDAYSHRTIVGIGPKKQSYLSLDAGKITDNMEKLSAEEVAKARCSIARQIWIDCANLACIKAHIVNITGRPEPDLFQVADSIDRTLKAKL